MDGFKFRGIDGAKDSKGELRKIVYETDYMKFVCNIQPSFCFTITFFSIEITQVATESPSIKPRISQYLFRIVTPKLPILS